MQDLAAGALHPLPPSGAIFATREAVGADLAMLRQQG
jgi:hypothetical protein